MHGFTIALIAAALAASPTTTQLPPHGGAFITTLPLGADIWVDGAYVGRTPAFVDLLAAGKHTIVVTRTGWEAQRATIDVGIGQTTQVSLTLARTSAANASHDVEVFPDTTTTISITAGEQGGPGNDILEPVSSYIPDQDVAVSGNQITIK